MFKVSPFGRLCRTEAEGEKGGGQNWERRMGEQYANLACGSSLSPNEQRVNICTIQSWKNHTDDPKTSLTSLKVRACIYHAVILFYEPL